MRIKRAKIKKTLKQRIREVALALAGKRLACKFIHRKHEFEYLRFYWEGIKPYRWKVHVSCCKYCGTCRRIAA